MNKFISLIRRLKLHEFYFSLPIEEKNLMHSFGSYLAEEELLWPNFSSASLLWVIAANAIPNAKHNFAKKILQHALTLAKSSKDITYIHSNLAQLYQDDHNIDKANYHCLQSLSTGYYNRWAVDTLIKNFTQLGKISEAKSFCDSIIKNDTYKKDRLKYEKILVSLEKQLEMPVKQNLLPQSH